MTFDLDDYLRRIRETSAFLHRRCDVLPDIAIITGTGLNSLVDDSRIKASLSYDQIPNFPVSTVQGHAGRLLIAEIAERDVWILQGRFHLYEGYAAHEVTFPLRVLCQCGLRSLVVTNAAGGLNLDFQPGDIMLIRDHINMMGTNCLSGPHHEDWGDRFPDMSSAYDRQFTQLARETAARQGILLHEGVYVSVSGPTLETPAETRLYRMLGADAIGMSTVQETIACVQAGVRVLGFSCITNVNDPDDMAPAPLQAILKAAETGAPKLRTIIHGVIERWEG